MSIAPKSHVRRTKTYKVVWYVKQTTFNDFRFGPKVEVFDCKFAVVRTAYAAVVKMAEFGMPEDTYEAREKHVGTAKTHQGYYWCSADKHTRISATPFRIE